MSYTPMFTADEVDDMRAEEEAGMQYTYTRTPLTDTNGIDAWYDEVYTAGVDVPNQICVFKTAGDLTARHITRSTEYPESGDLRTINKTALMVPLTDPVKAGDIIKHIVYTPTAEVVSEGPYHVQHVDLLGGDMLTLKVVVLVG